MQATAPFQAKNAATLHRQSFPYQSAFSWPVKSQYAWQDFLSSVDILPTAAQTGRFAEFVSSKMPRNRKTIGFVILNA
ncbi:MAG: hypothetical protein ACI4GO_01805 [Hominenteromicrobium sp.]